MEDSSQSTSKNLTVKSTTESNFKSYKKKHEMVLTLNKASLPTADETPTPTRFIRNCEEIGLFQDLQNVNPFEETFRKAAESFSQTVRHETVTVLGKAAGDDLHTPHLFPDVQSEVTIIDGDVAEEVVVRSEADTSLSVAASQPGFHKNVETLKTTTNADNPIQVIFRMPNGDIYQLSSKQFPSIAASQPVSVVPSIKPNMVALAPTPSKDAQSTKQDSSQKNDVKSKLKAFLGAASSPVAKLETKFDFNKTAKKRESTSSKSSPDTCASDSDQETVQKRQRILERNREAAYRCRAKRKKWVEELVVRAEQMAGANRALIEEVSNLTDEVHRLKSLLLAHANCPVTLAVNARLAKSATLPKVTASRENLTLNLQKVPECEMLDLDSPSSVVKKDEVLASVAPPFTPDEKIVTFPDSEREDAIEALDDKISSTITATTVIQINPNLLKSPNFS